MFFGFKMIDEVEETSEIVGPKIREYLSVPKQFEQVVYREIATVQRVNYISSKSFSQRLIATHRSCMMHGARCVVYNPTGTDTNELRRHPDPGIIDNLNAFTKPATRPICIPQHSHRPL